MSSRDILAQEYMPPPQYQKSLPHTHIIIIIIYPDIFQTDPPDIDPAIVTILPCRLVHRKILSVVVLLILLLFV